MPLIAMTCETGSLGKDVAAAVADRLDKQEVHHEIIDNLALAAHIRSALRQDPRTARMMLSITCEDGVATLTGLVDPGQEPKNAADVASRVAGVKEVKTQLRSVASAARHHTEG